MRITTRAGACACLLLAAGIALAADAGDLDTTFGQGGVTVSDPSGMGEVPYAVALQSDGKIVVGGQVRDTSVGHDVWFLARYDASGNLDTGYGEGGLVLPLPARAEYQPLWDLALDADDRAVATGWAVIGTEVVKGKGKKQTVETVFDLQCVVVRVDANGALDETFGDGGIVVVHTGLDNPIGRAVLIQPDGKIVIGGGGRQPRKERKGRNWWITNNIGFIARLDASGDPDPTFGDGGLTLIDQVDGMNLSSVRDGGLVRQSDGSLLVANALEWDPDGILFWLIHRYDADGILDTGFGVVGLDAEPNARLRALAVDGMDSIYAAGYLFQAGDAGIVVRYDADGTLDAGFGDGGVATLVGDGNGAVVRQIVVDDAERVYAFGGPSGVTAGSVSTEYTASSLVCPVGVSEGC